MCSLYMEVLLLALMALLNLGVCVWHHVGLLLLRYLHLLACFQFKPDSDDSQGSEGPDGGGDASDGWRA